MKGEGWCSWGFLAASPLSLRLSTHVKQPHSPSRGKSVIHIPKPVELHTKIETESGAICCRQRSWVGDGGGPGRERNLCIEGVRRAK